MTRQQTGDTTMIDQRWTTVDGKIWTLGNDKYRARIELIDESFYAATVEQMTIEGGWEDLVSYATFLTRTEAENHVLQVIGVLTQIANDAENQLLQTVKGLTELANTAEGEINAGCD